jgi:hypothetical protein
VLQLAIDVGGRARTQSADVFLPIKRYVGRQRLVRASLRRPFGGALSLTAWSMA